MTEKHEAEKPEPTEMRIPDRKYQPSRAELNEAIDMPEMSVEEARAAFMRPFVFNHDTD